MGGVARRATAILTQKAQRVGIPSLILETGNLTRQTDKLEEPINPWMVAAMEELGTNAVNTTIGDLLRLNLVARRGKLPKEKRTDYLATTVDAGSNNAFPVKPYVVQKLQAADGKTEVNVGILGLSPASAEVSEREIKTTTAEDALRRYLPEVVAQSDLVVLMTRMPDQEISRLAHMFPVIDVIVNGSPTGEGRELPRIGNTVIVESAHEGVSLGILDLEWDAKGHLTKSKNQMIPLPPMLPDAARMITLLDKVRREMVVYAEEEARRSPPLTIPSILAGAQACKKCHEKAYRVWGKSAHARAIETLKATAQQYNGECLQCHVTGFGASRGYVNLIRTPELVNVQCEACHSPALDHSKDPENKHPGLGLFQQSRRRVSEGSCLRCHTAERSPKFRFADYWQKIAH
jgi:hypothetical protein